MKGTTYSENDEFAEKEPAADKSLNISACTMQGVGCEELYRILIENLQDAVVILNREGHCLFANKIAEKLTGYTLEEIVGRRANEIILPEFGRLCQRMDQMALSGKPVPYFEVEIKRKDGRTIPVETGVQILKRDYKIFGILIIARDISERKRAEEELRKQKEKAEEYLNIIGSIVVVLDANGKIVLLNKKGYEVLGYEQEELVEKDWFETCLPRKCRERVRRRFKKAVDEAVVPFEHHENPILTKLGEERLVSWHNTLLKDEKGKIIGTLSSGEDVTERRQYEQMLQESEARFGRMARAIPVVFYVLTPDLKRTIYVSPAFEKVFGYNCNALMVNPRLWIECIHPKDRENIVAYFKKHHGKKFEVEYRIVRSDKLVRWIRDCTSPIRNQKGELLWLTGFAEDVTERKMAEQTIQESREKFERLFMNVPEAVVYWDSDYRVIDINPRFTQLFGFTLDEIKGKKSAALMVPEDKVDESALWGKKARDGYVDHDTIRKRKDGSLVPVSMSVAPMIVEEKLTGYVGLYKDITERNKADGALRDSEEQARRLLEIHSKVIDTATVWIDLLDEEGNVTLWNRAAELMSGYSREEVIGHKKIWEWLYPDPKYRDRIFTNAERIINLGERVENYLTTIKCKNGTVKDISWYSNNIVDEKEKPVGSIVIGLDVTEVKKAQERIIESEEKYRNLFENAQDLILTLDVEGKITSVNREITKYGYDRESIIGKSIFNFIPEDDWQRRKDHLGKLAHGRAVESEFRIKIKNSPNYAVVESRSNPIIQRAKAVGVQTILRDITERRAMETKLKQYSEHLEELVKRRTDELLESEGRYSVLVEEASDGVLIVQGRRIAFANRKAAEILGYVRGELLGFPAEKLVSEERRENLVETYRQGMRRKEALSTYEVEVLTKIGEHVPVEVSSALVNLQGQPAVLAIMRDIRERKRLEEQRVKLEKLATIGELATMVAHDLRNPLTSIRNASFYVRNTCPHRADLCKEALEMLNVIEQETLFANSMINDLLDFAAKRPLEKKKQNLNNIMENVLTKSNISENIDVKKSLAEESIAAVDEKQLERVFLNLIKNALQAMPDGGKLAIIANEMKDGVEISITDTGVGIPEENMSKIFQPLFTTKSKGIGMGLAICKRIVEQHGGTIAVKSIVGQGSTFIVKLPKEGEE